MTDQEMPPLDVASAPAVPWPLFEAWLERAVQADLPEPTAMTLATVAAAGTPSARVVLLRGWDERGFRFYTNYLSRKGEELAATPAAALVFFWAPLQRQIRIEGSVAKVTPAESDAYFRTRPRGHRLGALASPQSRVLPDRSVLEIAMADLERRYGETEDVPRPEWWGGYRVEPVLIEFWQGRANRLHDRLLYRRGADAGWARERLAP